MNARRKNIAENHLATALENYAKALVALSDATCAESWDDLFPRGIDALSTIGKVLEEDVITARVSPDSLALTIEQVDWVIASRKIVKGILAITTTDPDKGTEEEYALGNDLATFVHLAEALSKGYAQEIRTRHLDPSRRALVAENID